MATSGKVPDVLVDTSVAVALVVTDHEFHDVTTAALEGRVLGLAGHAAFESFSVLTRLPPPARRPATVVARILATNFPASRYLSVSAATNLVERFAFGEITGGSVYDALVGAAAAEHGTALATSDLRALDTYRVLGVDVEILNTSAQTETG